MSQTVHQTHVPDLVQDRIVRDRIGDLYATANEIRQGRRQAPACDPGLVTRTRWSVGRRLESFGQTVAGTHARGAARSGR